MASSGYLGTSNQYVKYWIEVITNSQNIANNTSNVTVKVWAKRTNTGYTTYGSGSVTLKVNGSYYNSGNKQIEITSSSKVYHSWTGDISHNGDGTKTLSCSAAININSVLSSTEQSYSENLKEITRGSTFTLSKSSCELGTSFTININRSSSYYTHAVVYLIGSEKRYIQNWNSSSISPSYTPPLNDALYMPNSTSLKATVIVETYNGSTLIGTVSKTITLTCPSNMTPMFSSVGTYKIANGDSAISCFVQGYSKIQGIINNAKGTYGSIINKYFMSFDGLTYSGDSNTFTSGVITKSGDIAVRGEIVDSRGRRSGVIGTTVKVEPYSPPKLDNVIVQRANSDFTYNEEGIYIQVRATKNYSSLNGENTCFIYASWREINGSWSSQYEVASNTNFNFNRTVFSADKAYQIKLKINDKINESEIIYDIATGKVSMDFKKGGKGVAIGKVSELDNTLDVGFDALFRKGVTINNNNIVAYGSNSNGEYVRFYDGTQICIKKITLSRINVNNTWGSGFTGSSELGNFPISFISEPYICINPTKANVGEWWISMGTNRTTMTFAGWVLIFKPVSSTGINYYADLIAIGRWK